MTTVLLGFAYCAHETADILMVCVTTKKKIRNALLAQARPTMMNHLTSNGCGSGLLGSKLKSSHMAGLMCNLFSFQL